MIRKFASAAAPLFVLLLPVLVAGCASGGSNGGGGGSTTVIVENDLLPPTSLRVYAVSEFGARTLVGHVSPGATETLRFRARAGASEYRFVGETMGGREVASNRLTFASGATLRWDVSANIATVQQDGGMD